jgi:hypothetical protein
MGDKVDEGRRAVLRGRCVCEVPQPAGPGCPFRPGPGPRPPAATSPRAPCAAAVHTALYRFTLHYTESLRVEHRLRVSRVPPGAHPACRGGRSAGVRPHALTSPPPPTLVMAAVADGAHPAAAVATVIWPVFLDPAVPPPPTQHYPGRAGDGPVGKDGGEGGGLSFSLHLPCVHTTQVRTHRDRIPRR